MFTVVRCPGGEACEGVEVGIGQGQKPHRLWGRGEVSR